MSTLPKCDKCDHERYYALAIGQNTDTPWSIVYRKGDWLPQDNEVERCYGREAIERAAYLTGHAHALASAERVVEALKAKYGASVTDPKKCGIAFALNDVLDAIKGGSQ